MDMDRGGSTGSLEAAQPDAANFKMGMVDHDDQSSQAKLNKDKKKKKKKDKKDKKEKKERQEGAPDQL